VRRSLRSWLYAFVELAGYSINLVTATIAAVSVGIGIDFAIHFIARYREGLDRTGDRAAAVAATGVGTGLALVASAANSAVGLSASWRWRRCRCSRRTVCSRR